jgi:diadenosine tetraphosphate (Ap4A) HIT family hydrolase
MFDNSTFYVKGAPQYFGLFLLIYTSPLKNLFNLNQQVKCTKRVSKICLKLKSRCRNGFNINKNSIKMREVFISCN